jgi:hypothetical protein
MKKTLVSVSDDLKDFCPLTTWQRLGMYWGQIKPFLFTAIAVTALVFGIFSFTHSFYRVASVSGFIAVFAIVWCVIAFTVKDPLAYVREQIRRRNKDGYWMIYDVDAADRPYAIFGPLTKTAMREQLKALHEGNGMHFVVPLLNGAEGFVDIGRKNPHPRLGDEAFDTIQQELRWWKVLPVHLTREWSDFHRVRIALKDEDGAASFPLSVLVAAQFIRSAPIGWLGNGRNNWLMAFEVIMDRQAKLVADLGRALAVMIRAAHDLHSDGRTLLTPCDMLAAEKPIIELLDDLLPTDHLYRGVVDFPPKPLPDVELAANKPPSPAGASPASDDDGHSCCSGP